MSFPERNELINLIAERISGYDCNPKQTAQTILDNFLSEPTELEQKKSLVKIKKQGFGKGKSRKLRNIYLDWKKLLLVGSESILTVVGATAYPILVPFAGLIVLNSFWSLLNININENHAAVLWAMWQNRDVNDTIPHDNLLNHANNVLLEQSKDAIDNRELTRVLNDLEKMSSIRRTKKNKWLLCEKVEIKL